MGRGGLETMIMNYYRNIDRTKIQFDFLVHRQEKADYDDEILSLGGHIYHMPMLNPFSKAYFNALDDFFDNHKYDIVHSHLDCMSAYPLKIAQKYGVKVRIAHSHNKSQDKNLKYPIKLLSKHLIPKYATHLFSCGKEAGDWMFGGNTYTVLNNAIDTEKYRYDCQIRNQVRDELKISKSDFVIGHVGRFNPPKNHSFLIDVFKSVHDKNRNSKLLLVGTGNGQSNIREKVDDLGLSDSVLFLGNRGDVNRILQAMDVFLFPSLYEGLPLSIIEAQAAGLPCIISDSVPSECRVTDLAESLDLNLPIDKWANAVLEKQSAIRKNTYQEIKNAGYDIEQNAKQLENFYIKNMKIWVKGIKYEANIDYFYSDIQSCTYNWSNI
jgi:glycosyltransferase